MTPTSLPPPPDVLYGSLFHDVQTARIFADSKTFVDCTANQPPAEILVQYEAEKAQPGFDLRTFVATHFHIPTTPDDRYVSDTSLPTSEHINRLWERLTRPADTPTEGSTRVPLPHPYVVPGGRFREIFYWDSYFTMLGLREAGRLDLMRGMLDNFAYLIDTVGFIPNGNRTYFLSRSQPPFFALMVELLAEKEGIDVLVKYEPQLRKEYEFWMAGEAELTVDTPFVRRAVHLPEQSVLNRYWDDTPRPRPEAYRQELELTEVAGPLGIHPDELYTHIRAACESGWDFSSRWMADGQTQARIQAANIVPVDLNCLIYALETTLQTIYTATNNLTDAHQFRQRAETRKQQIQTLFWNEQTGFFHDIDAQTNAQTPALTLAAVFPLFFGLATDEQADQVHVRLRNEFLQAGGWVTTLTRTGEQWDWPNGWAPLQWMTFQGLRNYSFSATADAGRNRWLALNDKVYKATGKMTEKYDVVDAAIETGGGEYPNQDGFGWTNGVYLGMVGLTSEV